MTTSFSEAELLRRLSFPRVSIGLGAIMSLLSAGCDGCVCPAQFETIVPLPRATYDDLLALYGAEGVPVEVCQIICAIDGSGGSGGSIASGGAGGTTTSGGAGGGFGGMGGSSATGGAGGMMTVGGSGGTGGAIATGGAGGVGGTGGSIANGGAGGMMTAGGFGGMGGSIANGDGGMMTVGGAGGGAEIRDTNVLSCVLTTIEFEGGAVECSYPGVQCGMGRRPARLIAPRTSGGTVAAFFARAAHLEAASVVAFRDLAQELTLHGTPRRLIHAAKESARDEARHARIMTKLARACGSTVEPVRTRPFEMRSLEALATHNAEEGIAGEAFGALLLGVQARRANSPTVRRALRSIARDEARHAVFSMSLGASLERRLSASARSRVRDARDQAFDQISRTYDREPSPSEAAMLGTPSAELAQDLLGHLRRLATGA